MVAAINFAHNAYQRWDDIDKSHKFVGRFAYSPFRRKRDESINRIFVELFRCGLAVSYAMFVFWLTGQLFE